MTTLAQLNPTSLFIIIAGLCLIPAILVIPTKRRHPPTDHRPLTTDEDGFIEEDFH